MKYIHKLMLSCVNSITNMGMFINMAQDQQLKSMIQGHYAAHVQDYNMKVEFFNKANGPEQKLNVPNFNVSLKDFTKSPIGVNFPSLTPRTNIQKMDDREIATAYLLTLKRAGREYAWAAMEAANPGLRQFLKDAFTMSCNHAYDVWQWMVTKGFYPLEPAPQSSINTIAGIYQEVREPSLV